MNKECNYCSDEGECLIENCVCHNCNEKYIDVSPEKVCLKYCDYEMGDEECINCIWRNKNEKE